jgi:hypothetical protein
MSARKKSRSKRTTTAPLPCAERLDAEREKLFKVMSIAECCRLACASKLVHDDPEVMVYALQAAYDLLDEAAGTLQVIRDEQPEWDYVRRGAL